MTAEPRHVGLGEERTRAGDTTSGGNGRKPAGPRTGAKASAMATGGTWRRALRGEEVERPPSRTGRPARDVRGSGPAVRDRITRQWLVSL